MTLRREWALVSASGLAVLAAAGLYRPLSLAVSVPLWAVCALLLLRLLPENRAEGGASLYPFLGAATWVTMFRGALVALASGFVREPEVVAPAYTAAAVLDHVDGRLARRARRETRLGAKLDMEIDAVGILVASTAGIVLEKLPTWYLLVGVARYVFFAGIWLRTSRGRDVRELDPSPLRRALAGAQMAFLATALWPFVPAQASYALSYAFGAGTLAMFVRDFLYVSSRRA